MTKRAPNGVMTDKPVALRLLPTDLQSVKEIAATEQRSLSSVSRLLVLRGIEAYRRDGNKLVA